MFEFNTQDDAETFRNFSGLIKSNNGLYKSAKQAAFLDKVYGQKSWNNVCEMTNFDEASDRFFKNFGVDVDFSNGQHACMVEGHMRWADYGTRSFRPITWIFVLDKHGVVAQYKLKYTGDMKIGCSVDASKTQKIWVREVQPVAFEEAVAEKPAVPESTHIGEVGKRMIFKGIIKSVKTFSRQRFHYYDSGVGSISRIIVDGSTVIYFGDIGKEGEEVTFKATVKEHGEYNGHKQTVVARPTVI